MLRAILEALAVLSGATAFAIIYRRISHIIRKLEKIMSQDTDLAAAVATLGPAIAAAVTDIQTLTAAIGNQTNDPVVADAITKINAAVASINAVVTPAAPAPAPVAPAPTAS